MRTEAEGCSADWEQYQESSKQLLLLLITQCANLPKSWKQKKIYEKLLRWRLWNAPSSNKYYRADSPKMLVTFIPMGWLHLPHCQNMQISEKVSNCTLIGQFTLFVFHQHSVKEFIRERLRDKDLLTKLPKSCLRRLVPAIMVGTWAGQYWYFAASHTPQQFFALLHFLTRVGWPLLLWWPFMFNLNPSKQKFWQRPLKGPKRPYSSQWFGRL